MIIDMNAVSENEIAAVSQAPANIMLRLAVFLSKLVTKLVVLITSIFVVSFYFIVLNAEVYSSKEH